MESSIKEKIEEIKARSIVAFLALIGHNAVRKNGKNHWFLSPIRNEKTASFKVDDHTNRWYDFGINQGGDLIDLMMRIKGCSFMEVLSDEVGLLPIPILNLSKEPSVKNETRIEIISSSFLGAPSLIRYLTGRAIPIEIGNQFCEQVEYKIGIRKYFAIGFKNDLGGYELRNIFSKLSSRPKGVKKIQNCSDALCVFEGFMDFLSFLSMYGMYVLKNHDFLILNSIAFVSSQERFMNGYRHVRLYLDLDDAGQNCSHKLTKSNKRFKDESNLYKGFKDLNEWLKAQDPLLHLPVET